MTTSLAAVADEEEPYDDGLDVEPVIFDEADRQSAVLWSNMGRHYSSLRFVILPLHVAGLGAVVWLHDNKLISRTTAVLAVIAESALMLILLLVAGRAVSRYLYLMEVAAGRKRLALTRWRQELGIYDKMDGLFRALTLVFIASSLGFAIAAL